MTALTYGVIFVGSLFLSFVLTRLVRNLALTRGWNTRAPNSRDVHTGSIPRLGGVAIFLSFTAVLGISVLVSKTIRPQIDILVLLAILLPSALIFLLGLFDDLVSVVPWLKFAVETLGALLVFFSGLRIIHVPLVSGHNLSWLASLIATVFWILLITNAFNLVDGLDGLAAGSALFATLTMMTVSLIHGRVLASVMALALAGAILGFLRYNFNPATIFLGDSGSLFIGFLLSVLALAGSEKSSTIIAVAIPIVSFGLPILETTLSVLRRLLNGQPLFTADREHIHHKLLERGLSQKQVVVLLYGVSALFGLLSAFLLYPSGATVVLVLFIIGVVIWLGVQHLRYPELFEIGRVAHRTIEQKQIIVNNLAFRRASSRLAGVDDLNDIYHVLQETFLHNDFDGFELRCDTRAFSSIDTDVVYKWSKNLSHVAHSHEPVWELGLELITSTAQPRGRFSIYKAYGKGSLRVDINLLLEEFRTGLADAVDRALQSADKVAEARPPLAMEESQAAAGTPN